MPPANFRTSRFQQDLIRALQRHFPVTDSIYKTARFQLLLDHRVTQLLCDGATTHQDARKTCKKFAKPALFRAYGWHGDCTLTERETQNQG